ncbi:flippase [Candidatus Parcubacteria bacterium]|nr:MAG: flippase [Candidatus Parcubacteria bacterium]
MSEEISLAKNTFYLTLASVGQKAIAFFYFALLARLMGVENTGSYFLALAVIMILSAFNDFGLNSVLIREVAKNKNQAKIWLRSVIGIKFITVPLTVFIAFVLPHFLQYNEETTHLIKIATIIMVLDTFSLTFYGALRGLHVLKYEAIGLFIGQLISAIIGSFLLLSGKATLPLLILVLSAGSLWNFIFSGFQVARYLGIKALLPGWILGFRPIKISFAFFLAAVFVKVYSYIDSFILSLKIGEHAVGIYSVAYKLTYAFQFIPLAFIAALYPAMSARSKKISDLKKILIDALWYVMAIGAPIVFGIWALAPEIIDIFYGTDYSASVLPLQILIFVLLFIFLDFPLGALLNATDRQVIKTGIMGATMMVNIVANLFFIPLLGVSGAAVSALISFIFMFAAGWYFVAEITKIKFIELVQLVWRLLLAAIVMAIMVILVKPYLPIFISVIIGALIYLMAVIAFQAVQPEYRRRILGFFNKYEGDSADK